MGYIIRLYKISIKKDFTEKNYRAVARANVKRWALALEACGAYAEARREVHPLLERLNVGELGTFEKPLARLGTR